MSVRKRHPNATNAAGAGGLGAVIITVADKLGYTLDPVYAAWIAAALPAAWLLIKRKGIKGVVLSFWKGDEELDPAKEVQ